MTDDTFGRADYEFIDSEALAGLGYYARAQVVNSINTTLLAECVLLAGGEVLLPPGFRDRIGQHGIVTKFLEPGGEYRIRAVHLPPELNHPGIGTRWERMAGPRRDEVREVWEVVAYGGGRCALARIDLGTGERMSKVPYVSLAEATLRRGAGGWRHWQPPDSLIAAVGGQDLGPRGEG